MLTFRLILVLLLPSLLFAQDDISTRIASLGQPAITNFSAKAYHAHPNNFDVVQGKDGMIYFGNLWSILQFDGTIWRTIQLTNGASCTALAVDDDGTIYVGGRNAIGYLRTDSIGRKKYVSMLEDLPPEHRRFNEVWRIAVSPDGIFFSSYEKLFFKDRQDGRLKILHQNPWFVFHELGVTYVSQNGGLLYFQNGALKKVPGAEFFDDKFINAITHLGESLLISTSEAGLFIFDGRRAVRWDAPINDVLRSYNPTKIQNVDNRFLIISTELNGLIITDIGGNILSHFNKTNGLAANTVSGFFLDQNKLLWITTYNGIASISVFREINFINEHLGVWGIPYSSAVYDDKLYLATSEGLFSKSLDDIAGEKFSRVPGVNGLVWHLSVIDGKLFCGHAISSLVIDHGKVETIFQEGTWAFTTGREPGTILMGTYSGLHYLKKEGNRWRYNKKIKGINVSARYFIEDRFADIWVCNDNSGVLKLRLNATRDSVVQTKLFNDASGLPHKDGNSIATLNDDIFISTINGVYTYDFSKEKIVPALRINSALEGTFSANIKRVVSDLPHNLWLIDNEGAIAKLRLNTDSVSMLLNTDLLRGNLISVFEHVNPVHDMLIAGTLDGFALYNQKSTNIDSVGLRAFVTRIETPLRTLVDGDINVRHIPEPVPFSENSIKFVLASNSYQDLNKNQFQLYLEGFKTETTWGARTSNPYKEYTNLPAGKYRLHVRVINFENVISKATIISFEILPPWYLTWWAYSLYAIIFIGINYFVYRSVLKKIEREKQRVAQEEQHVMWMKQKEWEESNLKHEKAMMQLEQEKLAMEHAALTQKQLLIQQEKETERQILEIEKQKLEADLRHKNTELTSLTLHIAQKNEIIHKIDNQLTKAIDESTDEMGIANLKEIRASLQKGLISDQDWDRFIDHFDTVHEGFLKRLKQHYPDLSSSTLKLCAFIKMRLSAKQIAALMNTAPDSVLKARYRLRTKFNLEKETGLEEFLNNF